MDLGELGRNWEQLARRDAMWAVLTWDDKKDGGWDRDEFFANGREEMARWLEGLRLARGGAPVPARDGGGPGGARPFSNALDFGCGVGRMVQALCDHAGQVTGVDISPAMIEQARAHNRFGDRAEYVLNQDPDLGRFADAAFELVHTCYVLQHMHPLHARRYLAELLRVLRPGGKLLLQVAGDRAEAAARPGPCSAWTPPVAATRPRVLFRGPVRAGRPAISLRRALRKLLGKHDARSDREPLVLRQLEATELTAVLENAGPSALPAGPSADGRHRWRIGTRVFAAAGAECGFDQMTLLPNDVAPGASQRLPLRFCAPEPVGRYELALDVHSGEGWLTDPGELDRWPLEVVAGPHTASLRTAPRIEMYCTPQHVVRAAVESAGARIERIAEDQSAGPGFVGRRYWIRKAGGGG